jgi:lipopolysaccharide heptosyltransferase II
MPERTATLPPDGRLLVRLPNWLGDVVFCTPALKALRKARPDLRVTALVKAQARVAVEGLPGISEVLELPGTAAGATWRFSRELKRREFDAVIVFPKGFREALLVWLARIPLRVGLDTDRRSLLLSHPVPFTEKDWHLHHARQFAKVLSPFGVDLADEGPEFPVSGDDRAEAVRVLREADVGGRFAAFHISASKPPRAWHAERFGQVGRALQRKAGLVPVLLGAPADALVHVAFREACPGAVDLAGRTSLREMAAVLERAALFVGNDSGPMHVAAAVGVPVVAVFGPGAPHKTAPYTPGGRCRVVYAALPCSPCRQAFWQECRPSSAGKPPCLEGIHPDAVLSACLDLLG